VTVAHARHFPRSPGAKIVRGLSLLAALLAVTLWLHPPEALGYAVPPNSLVRTAQGMLGLPYKKGGGSPLRGFDCSGLTHFVFERHGQDLARTAHGQYQQGLRVERRDLQPGDLVFFSSQKKKKRVTHVGLYIGQGQFIHAATKERRVQVNSLGDDYWAKRYVGAKRVAGA
jgi:cell wall-associated NlpC family hydrolase